MKHTWYCSVAALSIITAPLWPQEPAMPPGGSKAMVFSFSGLSSLNLNQFEGGIGGKYILSNATIIRAGLQLAVAGSGIPANPPPGQTGTDGSVSATKLGVSGALEYHLTRSRISPYIGGGAALSSISTESENPVLGAAAQTTTKNNVNGESIEGNSYFAGMTIAIYGILGLEYFVASGVSLAAEYRLGYSTTSRYNEEAITGNTTVTTKAGFSNLLGLSTGGALSAAIYF